jgi:hypothetical protein
MKDIMMLLRSCSCSQSARLCFWFFHPIRKNWEESHNRSHCGYGRTYNGWRLYHKPIWPAGGVQACNPTESHIWVGSGVRDMLHTLLSFFSVLPWFMAFVNAVVELQLHKPRIISWPAKWWLFDLSDSHNDQYQDYGLLWYDKPILLQTPLRYQCFWGTCCLHLQG